MGRRTLFHTLDCDRFPPSIERLPAAMTINSTTVYPTFRYNGKDANATSWPAWGYGETLTLQAGTAPTYNNGSPLLGSMDDSVKFNNGGYYTGSNALGSVSTNDFVLELLAYFSATNNARYVAGGTWGEAHWAINVATTVLNSVLAQNGAVFVSTSTGTPVVDALYHVLLFVDRSGSAQFYLNGIASGSPSVVAGLAGVSLGGSSAFCIGNQSAGDYPLDKPILLTALWQSAAWLDTHLQATVAKTRFAQLTGVYPAQARGTALPSVMARTTAAYLDKIEADGISKLYYVGANWPRVCSRKDTNGNIVRGYLSETQAQNLVATTTLSSWTQVRMSVTTTPIVLPDGSTGIANVTAGTVDNNNHRINPDVITFTNGTKYCYSVYAKSVGSNPWFALTADGGSNFVWFNSATGAIGTQNPGMTGISENKGNGWYRFQLSSSVLNGTVQIYIFLAPSDGVSSYAGTTSDCVAFWHPQVEASGYMSSDITTAGSPVTRTVDSLRYVMNDGNLTAGKGSLVVDFMGPNAAQIAGTRLWELSDGTGNNQICIDDIAGVKVPSFLIYNGEYQANIAGATDIWNGNKHTIRATWKTNQVRQYVDGVVDGTEDTSCAIPVNLSQLDVGAYLSAGYEANGLLSGLRIFNKPTTKI